MTKYIVLIGDGMADYPIPVLGGKTPLEVAKTPHMDRIASCRIGLVKTIPEGMEPGSDVANLALLGYDPAIYHTGRGPLEAASMGVPLNADQVAFRMNLVTLSRISENRIIMVSHSAGEITTQEGSAIVADLKKDLERPGIRIYPGVAYRHLLVWENGPENVPTIAPHDVLDQNMAPYLFENDPAPIQALIRSSWPLLEKHPVNIKRKQRGLEQANSIWLWGQGKAPQLPSFSRKFGLTGGVISAVDLLKGIGVYAGLQALAVEGATGYLNSNFKGKVEAALGHLRELDFIFLHVEAPDEAGHRGDIAEKIEAVEVFDARIVGPILEGLQSFDDFRVMVASDHLTPISRKTHTADPTTFAWASKDELNGSSTAGSFTENAARQSNLFFEKGHDLMPSFLGMA
ncbi:MAG: cofactor-independent phosphoglycerate mutase [Deltaproteobacteria bacterium]|nr:cofactor-independent phosphoglycerate mutase [Deltaproteobacteria bacterium]